MLISPIYSDTILYLQTSLPLHPTDPPGWQLAFVRHCCGVLVAVTISTRVWMSQDRRRWVGGTGILKEKDWLICLGY